MQAIVKTDINGKEEREVIESVTCICQLDNCVAVSYDDDDGAKTKYVVLNGYTDILLR